MDPNQTQVTQEQISTNKQTKKKNTHKTQSDPDGENAKKRENKENPDKEIEKGYDLR